MLGSFLNASSDANAVSDLTYTFTSSNRIPSSSFSLCSSDCSSYHFLHIFHDLSVSGTTRINYSLTTTSGTVESFWYPSTFSDLVFNFSSDLVSLSITASFQNSAYIPNHSITFVLSEKFGALPSGSLFISENGTYDVSSFAEAVVNVPPEIIQGDYHNDLVSINNSILIVAAVGLVIYFFYAIYRMILRGRR